MSWIWFLPALLSAGCLLVFYPLFSKSGGRPLPVGLEGDPLVTLAYERDLLLRQLKEIRLETGQTTADKTEIKRLEVALADVLVRWDAEEMRRSQATDKHLTIIGKNDTAKVWGISAMLLVALATSALYLLMGTPQDIPPSQEPVARAAPDVLQMVRRLAERLTQEPDNDEGWMRLARSYAALEQYDQAVLAYAHLMTRHPQDMTLAVDLAEIQVRSGDAELVTLGLALFEDILKKDPTRPEALWFTGAVAFQVGETALAVTRWQRLLKQMTPGSQDYQNVQEALQRAQRP